LRGVGRGIEPPEPVLDLAELDELVPFRRRHDGVLTRRGAKMPCLVLLEDLDRAGGDAAPARRTEERMRNTSRPITLSALALVIAFGSVISPQSSHAAGLDTSSRIIAPPRVTERQVVRYLVPKYNGAYTNSDVHWMVGRYFDVSVESGVDPLVVIAQMDHETAHLSSY
jgi:hypothetical protein